MPERGDVRFGDSMYKPDALDLRITREIGTPRSAQWNVRESYASIAKRVGVDEETVRKRIKKQEKMGIIQGWRATIHPNLIGCVDAFVDLEVNSRLNKEQIISQLKLLEGVVAISNFEGRGLDVFLFAEPERVLSRKVQLICTMCGADDYVCSNYLPSCDMNPTETDWRIIWSMRNDPRKSISDIAKEARVASKTVNRRLKLLTDRRALFLIGLPNFRQTAGTTGNFLISCSDKSIISAVSEAILSKFQSTAFVAVTASYQSYNIFFHNLSEAEAALQWIENLDGVTTVRMWIMKDLSYVWDWLDDQMKKHLTTTSTT
jgi:DNA-binding Lrp family transcriptional regulator